MAISGLVVMPMGQGAEDLQARLLDVEGLSVYGHAGDGSIVCVLEAPASQLEGRLKAIGELAGVAAVLPTSVNIEDELEGK